jgi:hypothetical protein
MAAHLLAAGLPTRYSGRIGREVCDERRQWPVPAVGARSQQVRQPDRRPAENRVPPPRESRDQRPLAEAIQGTWSNGPVTVVFSGSGTFTVTILGANAQSGHWSVDGDGKLVADLGGHRGETDAWIVGDQLTVSLGDRAFTLNRTSS